MKQKLIFVLIIFIGFFVNLNLINAEDSEEAVKSEGTILCDYGGGAKFANKNGTIFGKFKAPLNSNITCDIRDYSYTVDSCPGYLYLQSGCPMGTCHCSITFSDTEKDNYTKLVEKKVGCIYKLKTGTSITLEKNDDKWKATASDGVSISLDDGFNEKAECPDRVYVLPTGYGVGKTYSVTLTSAIDNGVDQDDGKNDQSCENAGKGGCLPEGGKGEAVTDICGIFTSDMIDLAKKIVGYVQIGTVFLALVLGILDFVGAIGSDKDNAFKEAGKKFLKRLIAVALVFLVPALLGIILNFISVANECNIEIFS